MLTSLIEQYGVEKINTLTKYPSILTLHKLGKNKILLDELTTPIRGEEMFATEKIDGTNIRLLFCGNERIVGTRENLFTFNHSDFNHVPEHLFSSIEYVRPFYEKQKWNQRFETNKLTVLYGELYGGNIGPNAKNYGTSKVGFRLFDVAIYDDLSVLELNRDKISKWRERETENGIIYGQTFLTRAEIKEQFPQFELVPLIPEVDLADYSHRGVLEGMARVLPLTCVALAPNDYMRPEGIVLRNADRSKIVKVRFEDYERTLRR